MQTITKYLALVVLCLHVQFINAQQSEFLTKIKVNGVEQYVLKFKKQDFNLSERLEELNQEMITINDKIINGSITKKEAYKLKKNQIDKFNYYAYLERYKIQEIKKLEEQKNKVVEQEKEKLKNAIKKINKQIGANEINPKEADSLKKELAIVHALNIENRYAILKNEIELLNRGEYNYRFKDNKGGRIGLSIGTEPGEETLIGIHLPKKDEGYIKKHDRRTTSDLVLAFGLNNVIIKGESLGDSPYKFGGSRFFEMGWAWKTRVFKNTNFVRFKYGYSFQINGLKPADNQFFVKQGNQTMLEEFPSDLKKSKLSITNLVFPMHFEFGPSKKIDKDTYFRYSTSNKFKIGIGGYGGFNIGTRQKLKYKLDGEHVKDKQKRGFNTSNLVYGLSGYIAFDNTALYVKYDLSPIFKDQIVEQNNISIGLRFDID